jgi:ATP-dependent DNA helicase RecG
MYVTRRELAEACGISSSGVKWQLKQLQANNIIRRVGPDKGGHWEIIETKGE